MAPSMRYPAKPRPVTGSPCCLPWQGLPTVFPEVFELARSSETPNEPQDKLRYVDDRAAAVLRAVADYTPGVPVVMGLDIGHTDPQQVIPNGGTGTVETVRRRVVVQY